MSFTVQILGSNSSLPAYGRHHTAQLVKVENNHFLIDCGEGTQYRFQHFKVKPSRINHIFISHLHGDHYLGLMGVIFSFHLTGRKKDLHLYGQKGLDDIINLHIKWSAANLSYRLIFHQLETKGQQLLFENKTVEVFSFPLIHKVPCCGFLIREKSKPRRINPRSIPENLSADQYNELKKGKDILDNNGNVLYRNKDLTLSPRKSRSYAFCSDTRFDPGVIDFVKAVDLLYHEATFLQENVDLAEKTKHSTTHEAARIALSAGAKTLMIGHYSARHRNIDQFVSESREVFENTIPAVEGETIEIPER